MSSVPDGRAANHPSAVWTLSPSIDAPFDGAFALAEKLGATSLNARAAAVDVGLVEAARERGLPVYVWTVNALEDMLELRRAGVEGFFSDYPGRMLEARARLLAS